MLGLFTSLLVKVAFLRALLALVASVLVVVPLGLGLLKLFALPLLAVLGILALPLLFVVALLGFPLFLVFAIAGVALGMLAAVVTFGVVALKLFLFVVLPVWLLYRGVRWMVRGPRQRDQGPAHSTP